jgi:hypothetical protein
MRKEGVPGLRFWDEKSRPTKSGTRNFVIWDQDVLDRTKVLQRSGSEIFKSTSGTPAMGLLNTDKNERPRGRLRNSDTYDGLLAREEAIARRRGVPHDSQLYSGGII